MLAVVDVGVGVKWLAVKVSVRTVAMLKAGTLNPMVHVGWSVLGGRSKSS